MAIRRKGKKLKIKKIEKLRNKGGKRRGACRAGDNQMKKGLCCVYGCTVMKKYNIGRKIFCL